MNYIILDWAGNKCFAGFTFESFDDAEEFLCEFFYQEEMDYEEWRGEYVICELQQQNEEAA